MTIIVKNKGELWTVEIDGQRIGEANTETSAEALIAAWRAKQPWVASWRFCAS